jgi:hypothetical protein
MLIHRLRFLGGACAAVALAGCGEVVNVGGPEATDAGLDRAAPTKPAADASSDARMASDADTKPDADVKPDADASSGCFTCTVPSGVVFATCAPTDGPAADFEIGPAATCGDVSPPPGDQPDGVSITVYEQLVGPTTLSFVPNGPNGKGIAQSCKLGVCLNAVKVTLNVATFTPTAAEMSASGSYDLELSDGSTTAGGFEARICNYTATCG